MTEAQSRFYEGLKQSATGYEEFTRDGHVWRGVSITNDMDIVGINPAVLAKYDDFAKTGLFAWRNRHRGEGVVCMGRGEQYPPYGEE